MPSHLPDHWLLRWQQAGLLDDATVTRIRDYEQAQHPHDPPSSPRLRWPVWVALAFGGMLLGAGILLFVAAHWEEMSAASRITLIVAVVGVFHTGAAFARQRFPALSTTLHAVGTVALGGAIAMAGQIFNMAEHWPSGILLWAAGAWAGVYLVRDWPHTGMAALLTPLWLISEWKVFKGPADQVLAGFLLLLAFTYLSAMPRGKRSMWRRCLVWIGGLAVIPLSLMIPIMGSLRAGSINYILLSLLPPLGLAYLLRKEAAWRNAVSAVWVAGLVLLSGEKLELPVTAWCALGSVGLVAWGVADACATRVNLGVTGFAISVLFFYFSSVMSAMDRSLSLILLGALFLLGGWQLEKLRRNLVHRAKEVGA